MKVEMKIFCLFHVTIFWGEKQLEPSASNFGIARIRKRQR